MSKLKKSKGFTLIELLVALSIVMIILLTFFKVIDNTTKMNVKNDIDIRALKLAKSEVENLRNQIKNYGQLENIEIKDVISILKNKTTNEPIYEGNRNTESIIIPFEKIPDIIPEEEIKDEDDIEIIYEKSEVVYTKTIEENRFQIYLDISKSEVSNEKIKIKNTKKNGDKEMYMYTINIYVKSIDNYFSKKETKIRNIKILSKNKS